MSSEWRNVNIGECVKSISQRHPLKNEKVILINTSDVLDGRVLNHSLVENRDLRGQFKKKFQKCDLLYSEIRPVNRRFAYIDFEPDDYVASTKLMVLRVNDKLLMSEFFFQFMKSKEMIDKLQTIAESRSGTFPQITFSELAHLQISIPTIKEQKEIAATLSCLDDKIELNSRMNKTLEEMAQAIFKSWFVDFDPFQEEEFFNSELGMIPKGWRVGTLDEVTSKFATGLNPRKNFVLGEGTNYYVTIKNMGENQVWLNDKCDKVTDEAIDKINRRSDLRMGDLLFSGIGTIGRVCLLNELPRNWNISESIFTLRSNDILSSEMIYQLLLFEDMQQYAKRLSSGSVQKGIRMADLKKYKLTIPPKAVVDKITQIFIELNRQTHNFHKQNNNLKSLRDTLLPKLMSGEIRVPVQED